jgi:hypothetical protein
LSRFFVCLIAVTVAWFSAASSAAEWTVPVGGNAFRSAPSAEGGRARRGDAIALREADEVYSVFLHVDRAATLDLALNARVPEGESTVTVRVGEEAKTVSLQGGEFTAHTIGRFEIAAPGYVRVDLQGVEKTERVFAEIRDLVVTSETEGLVVDFVKSNEGNMFYWGRRGPSVHLSYETPEDAKLQFAYSEITVPEGQDTIGSYFMANGFGEGYFGIQVNGPEERRVLFSVWSPFQTDNPRDIPEDKRIERLGSGPEVHVGEFGNEGAGGQSYLVYPWKAGVTYAFLTEVKPVDESSTVYTAWFQEKTSPEWKLIASFRRPVTQTYLRRFHSFLENFNPAFGHVTRGAQYGNVWVRDVDGVWHECTEAKLSVDATGGGRHRLDFDGGAEGDHFFLRNCGFFNESGKVGATSSRKSTADQRPEIDFDSLPR